MTLAPEKVFSSIHFFLKFKQRKRWIRKTQIDQNWCFCNHNIIKSCNVSLIFFEELRLYQTYLMLKNICSTSNVKIIFQEKISFRCEQKPGISKTKHNSHSSIDLKYTQLSSYVSFILRPACLQHTHNLPQVMKVPGMVLAYFTKQCVTIASDSLAIDPWLFSWNFRTLLGKSKKR